VSHKLHPIISTLTLTEPEAALPSMSHDLGVSQAVTNLTVAFYMLAMSIFPLWWYEAGLPVLPSCFDLD
jgi:hypothetical protein